MTIVPSPDRSRWRVTSGRERPLRMLEASAARTRAMVMIKDIEYAGDGSTMIGRLALPEGDDHRPAVLIAHEGGGLDDYQKGRAERFAELGYVAFARGGADVKAIVGFHPRLATRRPQDSANIRGKVLVCVGTDDPLISAQERLAFEEEMRAGGVDWRMNLYGGTEHSFTNRTSGLADRPGVTYHHLSDERSWRAMLDLLHEVFP